MTYYITLEVRTDNALGTGQQDKLRDAVLAALDANKLPYSADVVTASVTQEAAW